MADWVGAIAASLAPLMRPMVVHALAGERIHADDTPVQVLAKGKTRTGRLWVMVRDDRPFGGPDPPVAVYFYSPDRRGEHPRRFLAEYTGLLQADAYSGFGQLYKPGRPAGPILEAACWAPARGQGENTLLWNITMEDSRYGKRVSLMMSGLSVESAGPSFEDAIKVMGEIVPNLDPYNGESVAWRAPALQDFLQSCFGACYKGKAVADIGGGNGGPILWACLAGGASRGFMMEYHPKRVEIINGVLERLTLSNIVIREGDINNFTEPVGEYDITYALDVLSNKLIGLDNCIGLMERLTKPGGFVLLKGPSQIYITGKISITLECQLLPTHFAELAEAYYAGGNKEVVNKLYTPAVIAEQLEMFGFTEVRMAAANATQWKLVEPARVHCCMPNWYIAARKPE